MLCRDKKKKEKPTQAVKKEEKLRRQ